MGDTAGGSAEVDQSIADFATYEEFLDSQVSDLDLYYLEDEELARQLVELGYRGSGEVIKREEFERRKQIAEDIRSGKTKEKKGLANGRFDTSESPFLSALATREEANRNGKMMSIVFVRGSNAHGQEVSGYIDFAQRLKDEDCDVYFSGKKKFLPKPTDLSFYNWATQTARSNASGNYQVLSDAYAGLLFKNKRDRKIINVDPKRTPGDNSTRTLLETDEYFQVVFFDHVTRNNA